VRHTADRPDRHAARNNNNNNGGRNAVAMKQTLGRQVGEEREHECNMHVCVGVG